MMVRRSRAIGPVVVGYPALLSRLSAVTMGTSYPPEVSAGTAESASVVPLYEEPVAVGAVVDNAAESGVGVFEPPIFDAPQPPVEEVAVAATVETLPVEVAPAESAEPEAVPVAEAPAEVAPVEPAVEEPTPVEPEAAPVEASPSVAEPEAPAKPAKKGPKAKAAPEAA